MPFCRYCGAPLEEGQVCPCRTNAQANVGSQAEVPPSSQSSSVPPFNPAVQQAVNAVPEYAAPQPAAPSRFSVYFSHMWALFVNTMKRPATTLTQFAASDDFKIALGVMAAEAVCFALFLLSMTLKLKSALEYLLGSLYSLGSMFMSGSSYELQIPAAKIFFLSLFLCFGLSILFAAILLLFHKIFQTDTKYSAMLCAASAKSLAVVPFYLLAAILIWLNIGLGFFAASVGTILSYFFLWPAQKGAAHTDDNKSLKILFLSFTAQYAAILLVVYIAVKAFI